MNFQMEKRQIHLQIPMTRTVVEGEGHDCEVMGV